MPEYWVVTSNGRVLESCFENRRAAEEAAQRMQQKCDQRGGKARRDIHIEVKRDHSSETDFDRDYDLFKRGQLTVDHP